MRQIVLLALLGMVAAGCVDDAVSSLPSSTTSAIERETTRTTALVGQPGADGVGDPYFPGLGNGGYDVDHYTLALTWSPADGSIAGTTTIWATATQDLSRFNLDLAGLEVQSVLVNGDAAGVHHVERELEITPATVIALGEGFTTVVSYAGKPHPVLDGTDLFEVGWHTDGREVFVASEPAGAATFFPVNDHPTDKATYTFEITAPDDQVGAATGRLTREDIVSSPTGTAPRISTVTRPVTRSSRPLRRSTSRPSRALGGPPCWKRASHGPVVCSVACQRSSPRGR